MLKKILLLLLFCCFSINSFSQEIKFKEYSYTQFFKMIEEEKDSVFMLKDALIKYNATTDSVYAAKVDIAGMEVNILRKDTITINKEIHLNNVQFLGYLMERKDGQITPTNFMNFGFYRMKFLKPLKLMNTIAINIKDCEFNDKVIIGSTSIIDKIVNLFEEKFNNNDISYQDITIHNSTFNSKVQIYLSNHNTNKNLITGLTLDVDKNIFNNTGISIDTRNIYSLSIINNQFNTINRTPIWSNNNELVTIENNQFTAASFSVNTENNTQRFSIFNNTFKQYVKLGFFDIIKKSKIDWQQWNHKVIASGGQTPYYTKITKENLKIRDSLFKQGIDSYENWQYSEKLIKLYINESQIIDKNSYAEEIKLRYNFYNFYKNNYDLENANLVYEDIKDLETKRFEYLYDKNPSFKTFFKWKINQFLKVFSNYGKEPERAVIFSMYVILLFAFIYLLFPNSWDSHGRKRIMDRYTFFLKYMDKDAGMHEVYINEQKENLLEFDEFKDFVNSKEKRVPKIFTATALPLYKWAISGTKLSSSLLKRVDIMKGTWNELPQSKRIWKSVLLITFFLIAIVYDIFIKMLNALMLSINTFTTLGFGEIPIKGLPRYLAIIQGFIGWFMLTIFSVSLISQLLN